MFSPIVISDDDDIIHDTPVPGRQSEMPNIKSQPIELSDDEDYESSQVDSKHGRRGIIKNLFPETSKNTADGALLKNNTFPNQPKHEMTTEGVKVTLPVEPYSCQKAVMSKVILALNKKQNCIVESPTGTGKTLALLCATLAWQRKFQDQFSEKLASEVVQNQPEMSGAEDYIASPLKKNVPFPENIFAKKSFGEKTIYDVEMKEKLPTTKIEKPDNVLCTTDDTTINDVEMEEPLPTHSKIEKRDNLCTNELRKDSLVTIHKRSQRTSSDSVKTHAMHKHNPDITPTKQSKNRDENTPEKIRELYALVENHRCRTSMLVDCSLPVIYYGARTHKQLQQVVKEFKRTVYCGDVSMTILSSRENTCLREFDRSQWPSKNDMCRNCTKTFQESTSSNMSQNQTNCPFYDNRKALNHKTLPSAFDLTDLVKTGERLQACPFYAAKDMALSANIVFCPYNYLVDPGIRNSMQINLKDNIVIIDEGHNIEDICRDTASFDFKLEYLRIAIKELSSVSSMRYANEHMISHIDSLLNVLKKWEQWFEKQIPLMKILPINNNEATKLFEMEAFVKSLDEYNIGSEQYNGFSKNVFVFCKKLREDPRTLIGVTQTTGSLLESLETVLGYLFRDSGLQRKHFTSVFVRKVEFSKAMSWRKSQFEKSVQKEQYILQLICLNPALIFAGLHPARTIVLASGTLTPIDAMKAELNTEFRHMISPHTFRHIIPKDRVWVGSLGGALLQCDSAALRRADVQDALARAVLAVCAAAPHGVLCFLPSYQLMDSLRARWQATKIWEKIAKLKAIFLESTDAKEHENMMERYIASAESRGALLLSVFRGKVAEGMDFKDRQARAVIAVGIPYSNLRNIAVSEKKKYNDKYSKENNSMLLGGSEWYHVHAYRALNQALGRCVRYKGDWGAVLLLDSRFEKSCYREHLPVWVKSYFRNNDGTVNTLEDFSAFMTRMTLSDGDT